MATPGMAVEAGYSPPSAVVGPAFQELRARHARALIGRARTGSGTDASENAAVLLSAEERAVVGYGVDARAGVVRRALTLVFAQWALHRGVVRHVPARAPRVLYGCVCAATTLMYVERSAKSVAHETFERIIALPTSSPLANEARVILAELEGPAGPYYTAVAADRGGEEDLAAAVAAQDAISPPRASDAHLHPQLRLRPRLLDVSRAPHPRIFKQKQGRGLPEAGPMHIPEGDGPLVVRREMHGNASGNDRQLRRGAESLGEPRLEDDAPDFGSGSGKTPFDFAKAARGDGQDGDAGAHNFVDSGDDADRDLTPSQRRAHARRERRRRARERGLTPDELGREELW